ncbi:hypothetical protein [Enterococcus sp. BWR-S5]|uniref:hypothetical protein n=1 Tax=Enterococcus sp. BWR-S5 TaxID=2787714 RepID=UPI0019215486|nr:hypothetical protein [Enterococcus sp. BWR-S5]MBL1227143.1 hypothetical protein [Enterococcus sp. BWR-S5]
MGYTTDFSGEFTLDRKLDPETHKFLKGLASTRRMKRDPEKLEELGFKGPFGPEGAFFVEDNGSLGQDMAGESIVEYNIPPETQPSLWCQWEPNEEGTAIVWDQGEKFYCYVEWIKYIIDSILTPKGYILNGIVHYSGEDMYDIGSIIVRNSRVSEFDGIFLEQLAN